MVRKDGKPSKPRPTLPVKIRGVVYPSAKAAGEALGVSPKTIHGAIRRGREDFVGNGTGNPMPINVRGVTYADAKEAAQALGVEPCSVHSAITRGNPDRLGLGLDYKARVVKGGKRKPVEVAGRRFDTVADLARFLGRDPRCVRVSLNAGGVAKGRIIRAVMEASAKEEAKARKERMA